jgi:hypothetical protein
MVNRVTLPMGPSMDQILSCYVLASTCTQQKGSCPFCLQYIIVQVGKLKFRGNTIPLFVLTCVTFVGSLEFTTQKNGIAGELIGLANTTDPYVCPMKAITYCIAHLHNDGVTADTPLYVLDDTLSTPRRIADCYLTQQLQIAASLLGVNVATTAGVLYAAPVPLTYYKATSLLN